MPMVMTDARLPDNPIVMANAAFLALTGYPAEEVLGRNCRFLQGPSTSQEALAELRAAIAEEREIDIELLNYKRDGTAFWNQLHVSPIHDENGQIAYFFASQIDVTEYRKVQMLEASEHRLLMEVDHRAKNVLAVVDSLVRLSRSDDPVRFAASVQQRIQALSQAHSMLAETGWREIPLKALLSAQLSRFRKRGVDIAGPEVLLPPASVQPLALVFQELAANAAAHGALSSPAGRLQIRWERSEDAGGFHLAWLETNGRPPAAEPKGGFGTLMAKAMVERQLSGRLQRSWLPDGVDIRLHIPPPSSLPG